MPPDSLIHIRPGTTSDEAACGRIIADATMASALPERLPHAASLWADRSPLAPEGRTRLVAELDGVVAGFADYAPDRAHVRYFFVSPECQGRGIGERLLEQVQRSLSCPISVHCLIVNDAAIRWYLRHGFLVVSGFLEDLEGQEAVWLRLRRELHRS